MRLALALLLVLIGTKFLLNDALPMGPDMRVDSKDQVLRLDHDQGEGERCQCQFAIDPLGKPLSGEIVRDRK
jgi:hypothetical protein